MKQFKLILYLFCIIQICIAHAEEREKDSSKTTPHISKWFIQDNEDSITLPFVEGHSYDLEIDWGDGTTSIVKSYNSEGASHIYKLAGVYTITMKGLAQAWDFGSYSRKYRKNLIEVVELGDLGWTNLSHAFYYCRNLVSFSGGETGLVKSMKSMFHGTSNLKTIDVSKFDTTNVTDMNSMFSDVKLLKKLDLKSFNTKNVTDMGHMFQYLVNLEELDISSFNTANVTYMAYMFSNLIKLAAIDLKNFNTQKVTSFKFMFYLSEGFSYLDLSSFNTTSAVSMLAMFKGARNLKGINLSSFKTGNVIRMNSMFSDTVKIASLDLSHFNTEKVTTMKSMFENMTSLKYLNIQNFDTSKVVFMGYMFLNTKNLTSLDLSHFNTKNVVSMVSMFKGTSKLRNLDMENFDFSNVKGKHYMFDGSAFAYSQKYTFRKPFVSIWRIQAEDEYITLPLVEGYKYDLFVEWGDGEESIIKSFDDSRATHTYTAPGIYKISIRGIAQAWKLFTHKDRNKLLHVLDFGDLRWKNLNKAFSGCQNLRSFKGGITSQVNNMRGMFSGAVKLKYLNLDKFNTSKVTDMSKMFYNLKNLEKLNLSRFNVYQVTTMWGMFADTPKLVDLDFHKYKVGRKTVKGFMFKNSAYQDIQKICKDCF